MRNPFPAKTGIVGEREPQIPGAHDRHRELAVEPQNHLELAAQILHDVPDAADAEVAEVREILANERRVETELIGQDGR